MRDIRRRLNGSESDAGATLNGNFVCSNNQNYQGAIIAPNGSVNMAGCSVATDVWARDGVTVTNGTIGGKVISSAGAVSLSGNTTVGGTVLAAGAISWPGCSASGKCFANQGAAAPPAPAEQFPILRSDPGTLQAWADAGYDVLPPDNNCSIGAAAMGAKVTASAQTVTTKTLYRTSCAVQFNNSRDIDFGADFALFASGGISTSNQVTFDSAGPVRNVYLIVPYDAASRPCATPGISTSNNFGSTSNVKLLVYSPCNVTYSNNGVPSQGQVYSGSTVQINNNYALTYAQMPVFGIDPASIPTLSYTVDILYKREVLNP